MAVKIRLKKLFVIAIVLKVSFSGIGWYISDPWIFGLLLPITVMSLYIILGNYRAHNDVTDEKFADSCYYIGFIFTITSIVFSLFDLPDIESKMSEIAVRFGVAMVSTVMGIAVRVYMVSFKHDFSDAISSAEDGVIDATTRLNEQLIISLEKLQEFDSRVEDATRTTLDRVAIGVEQLTESYSNKISLLFEEISNHNRQAFESALNEVKGSTNRLTDLVDYYSSCLRSNLDSIEGKISYFSDAVTKRLDETAFPDDYFSKKLEAPVNRLCISTEKIALNVAKAAKDVDSSVDGIQSSLGLLRSRSDDIEYVLDRVVSFSDTQDKILAGAHNQVETLSDLSRSLKTLQINIDTVTEALVTQTTLFKSYLEEQKSQTSNLSLAAKELTNTNETLTKSNKTEQNLYEVIANTLSEINKEKVELGHRLVEIENKMVQHHEVTVKDINKVLDQIVSKLEGIVREVPSFKDILENAASDRAYILQRLAGSVSLGNDSQRITTPPPGQIDI
ncbi:hypothetical protein [Methylotuvimicrobium buryatense]|uniref:MotA/TolQ/ExbB proton channel domain-containing protein n=1 Tax=Methylotuvimicrobium buryatense TaxID=95641 RepID=A0A4P9ULK7_METBY|nr:hypothetical protein [Methylotuvimicrobium buryatense]QCW81021.1 hypothetical protein EQU24_01195 [Methylotuvimicrobium buryatense]